jgi:hypothetical protein
MLFAEQVHRPPFAFGAARGFAVKFRHNGFGTEAAGKGMSVVAVGRDNGILRGDGGISPGHHGFLTYVQVAEAFDFLLTVKLGAFFFKAPYQKHGFKPFVSLFWGYLRG